MYIVHIRNKKIFHALENDIDVFRSIDNNQLNGSLKQNVSNWVSEWMNWMVGDIDEVQYNPTMCACVHPCNCCKTTILQFVSACEHTCNWLLNKQMLLLLLQQSIGTHRDGNRCIRFWKLSENQCHFRFDAVKEILFTWNKRFCYWYSCCFLLLFLSLLQFIPDCIAMWCNSMHRNGMACKQCWQIVQLVETMACKAMWIIRAHIETHSISNEFNYNLKWIRFVWYVCEICVSVHAA